jgi:hypothetical protein
LRPTKTQVREAEHGRIPDRHLLLGNIPKFHQHFDVRDRDQGHLDKAKQLS